MRYFGMARLLLCGSIAVVWIVGGALDVPRSAADEPASIGDLEQSIVLIETTWSGFIQVPRGADESLRSGWTDRVTAHSLCTAFYVDNSGDLVTAGHCVNRSMNGRFAILEAFLADENVPELLNQAFNTWKVQGTDDGSVVDRQVQGIQPSGTPNATLPTLTPLEVVDFDKAKYGDVAILRAQTARATPAIPVAQNPPKIGTPLTSIGFPGELSDVTDRSRLPRPSFKTGTVSSIQVGTDGFQLIEVNTDIEHGMSGGPTVDASGAVVGVNSLGLNGSGNFNFVTYTSDLWRILSANGVRPQRIPSATPTAPTITMNPPAVTPTSVSASTTATEKDSAAHRTALTSPILLGSGGIALLAVLIGAVAFYANRRKAVVPAGRINYCPNCGAVHPPHERFCRRCGARIERD